MTNEQEPNVESLRKSLKSASLRIDDIKAKLCNNESRLIALEDGRQGSRVQWDDARKSADTTIASIAAIEIGIRAFDTNGLTGVSTEQPLVAMPEFTDTDLQAIAARGESAQFGAINMMQGYLGVGFQQFLRGSVNGISPDTMRKLLPASIRRPRKGRLTHVVLHAAAQNRFADSDNNM